MNFGHIPTEKNLSADTILEDVVLCLCYYQKVGTNTDHLTSGQLLDNSTEIVQRINKAIVDLNIKRRAGRDPKALTLSRLSNIFPIINIEISMSCDDANGRFRQNLEVPKIFFCQNFAPVLLTFADNNIGGILFEQACMAMFITFTCSICISVVTQPMNQRENNRKISINPSANALIAAARGVNMFVKSSSEIVVNHWFTIMGEGDNLRNNLITYINLCEEYLYANRDKFSEMNPTITYNALRKSLSVGMCPKFIA